MTLFRDTTNRSPIVYTRDFAYPETGTAVVQPRRASRTKIALVSADAFARLLTGPMGDFFIGPERKHWSVHHSLLAHHTSGPDKENLSLDPNHATQESHSTDDTTIELPECSTASFELLLPFLYQGKHPPHASDLPTNEAKYAHATSCHGLHLIGKRLRLWPLSDLALDAYRSALHSAHLVPDPAELTTIYKGCGPEHEALKKLMIRIAARQIMDPEVERDVGAYEELFGSCPEFAVGVLRVIREESGGMLLRDPNEGGWACTFHDHEDGEECDGMIRPEVEDIRTDLKTATRSQESGNSISSTDKPKRPPRKIRISNATIETPDKSIVADVSIEYSPPYRPPHPASINGIMKKSSSNTGESGTHLPRHRSKLNGTGAKVRFRDRSLSSSSDTAVSIQDQTHVRTPIKHANGGGTSRDHHGNKLPTRRGTKSISNGEQTQDGADHSPDQAKSVLDRTGQEPGERLPWLKQENDSLSPTVSAEVTPGHRAITPTSSGETKKSTSTTPKPARIRQVPRIPPENYASPREIRVKNWKQLDQEMRRHRPGAKEKSERVKSIVRRLDGMDGIGERKAEERTM
ncbi:unnamed protein product [Zymoseptoria tritici ST99CH_3D1]|nr:unnamed protein product [Zymoseptoria tritici ST99CH_3D1]